MMDLKLNDKAEMVMVEVPTVVDDEEPAEAMNTNDLSEEDLRLLHAADPFMYYSIAGEERFTSNVFVSFKAAYYSLSSPPCDPSCATASRRAAIMGEATNRTDANTNAPQGSSAMATRRTRISFEQDPVTLMFGNIEIDIDEEDDILDDDDYESLLFGSSSKQVRAEEARRAQ